MSRSGHPFTCADVREWPDTVSAAQVPSLTTPKAFIRALAVSRTIDRPATRSCRTGLRQPRSRVGEYEPSNQGVSLSQWMSRNDRSFQTLGWPFGSEIDPSYVSLRSCASHMSHSQSPVSKRRDSTTVSRLTSSPAVGIYSNKGAWSEEANACLVTQSSVQYGLFSFFVTSTCCAELRRETLLKDFCSGCVGRIHSFIHHYWLALARAHT